MGMLITARRIEDGAEKVRYEFGFDEDFDRVLAIDKQTLAASVEDGNFNSAASVITAKIVSTWRASGDFPPHMVFAG